MGPITMATTLTAPSSLEDFLKLPEEKPALEFFDGQIYQKPMPKRQHSILQFEIASGIHQLTKPEKIAYAFPELRCPFAGRSIVSDVVILTWEHIDFNSAGEVTDDVLVPPGWIIEILSPDQNSGLVIRKILFSLEQGGQLVWRIDPPDRSVVAFYPDRLPKSLQGSDPLPVLQGIP
ncbi:Uma2 family endonuclease [Synechococcus sp. Nb3U1]|uniref:Uma2 family endonuclease n=1 Tax=Synechococcus sp. Nb3U1 TaxID=1914529 RepID=UPI001F33E7DB|nr:Uma2 family endonuclease [Synechococcus sp. Nb3U1]MCF2969929.1 Uma2 family endonuclease [Synechococcus sp. Nb3U1]